jgi:hypothetical protein
MSSFAREEERESGICADLFLGSGEVGTYVRVQRVCIYLYRVYIRIGLIRQDYREAVPPSHFMSS